MATVVHLSDAARNAALNAIAALMNSGTIEIYSGTMAATTSASPPGDAVLLAELAFASTAFGAASSGSVTVASVTGDVSANATGSPTWCRFKNSGGTVVLDGNAATANAFLILPSATITSGSPVDIVTGTLTLPSGV